MSFLIETVHFFFFTSTVAEHMFFEIFVFNIPLIVSSVPFSFLVFTTFCTHFQIIPKSREFFLFSSMFLTSSLCKPHLIDSMKFQSSTFLLPRPWSYRLPISAFPCMDGIFQLLCPARTFTRVVQENLHLFRILYPPSCTEIGYIGSPLVQSVSVHDCAFPN